MALAFNKFQAQIHYRTQNKKELDPLLRSDSESEIEEWLANWNIDEILDIVSMLVNLNFTIDDLLSIAKDFTSEQFPVILSSLGNIYAAHKIFSN